MTLECIYSILSVILVSLSIYSTIQVYDEIFIASNESARLIHQVLVSVSSCTTDHDVSLIIRKLQSLVTISTQQTALQIEELSLHSMHRSFSVWACGFFTIDKTLLFSVPSFILES
jgi:7tm Chemosensory receptor